MPELFLELFSEEIPARMQEQAAVKLGELVSVELAQLSPNVTCVFDGPRRIAMVAEVIGSVPPSRSSERGPRRSAPQQALNGFLRKHGATREQLREEGDYWVLDKMLPDVEAAQLISKSMPNILRSFPWPKSMRWGGTSQFTWVRPLRRIVCLLDGAVVKFDLREGEDDGHGLASSNLTEGHRFLSPGAFAVNSCADWAAKLRARHVIVDAGERRTLIREGLSALAATRGLEVVDDYGLLAEVAGLVEWPVPLIGAIDAAYMNLPQEVMQVSMRVNQRYFALRDAFGPAPFFAFVANMSAPDGGAAIVAGNERVLRARFADARHFWDQDRTRTLESRVAALDAVTFHAKLGSQGDRVRRLVGLAGVLAAYSRADRAQAERAALLAKADLTTGMVGELPELQGVMGGYYARHDEEDACVADAIRDHYAPKGPSDAVPHDPVGVTVALADKVDLLAAFFTIGEKPTGSGDPYALRRAALGVIRIVRERQLRIALLDVLEQADKLAGNDAHRLVGGGRGKGLMKVPGSNRDVNRPVLETLEFLLERLRVQLRAEGARYDVLNAVLGTGVDDDITRLLARTEAVAEMLDTEDGANLLAAYRRAASILRIEEKKDGPHDRALDPALMEAAEEIALAGALDRAEPEVAALLAAEDFASAMTEFAALRPFLDAFFNEVTVNDARKLVRLNRLALLARVRAVMGRVADFSRIEG